jgi:hypothetical protein
MKTHNYLFILLLLCTGIQASPLNGNYSINSASMTGGTNFQSFNDLADSLNLNGISGNVVVTVVAGSGPYNEKVSFDSIPGTSDTSTIIIDGSNETITDMTDSTDRYIVRLWNCQFVTITNLHIQRQSAAASGFYGIHIMGSGRKINVTHCVVDMGINNSTLIGGVIASGSTTNIIKEGDFNDIVVSNDTFTGGGYSVSVYGKPGVLARGIVISDNVCYDFHTNGIMVRETDSVIICRNFMDKRDQFVVSVNCIQLAQSNNVNGQVYGNQIKVSMQNNLSQEIRGIYLFDGNHRVYNNVINDINLTSGDFTAIEARSNQSFSEIYFNTISIDNPNATAGELIGFKETLNNTGTILKNNIISITQPTTGIAAGIALGSNSTVASAIESDYNDIYVPNGHVACKGLALNPPVYFTTLSSWRLLSTQDSNSYSVDPGFISQSSSIPTNSAIDNQGTPLSFITDDILGTVRNIPPDLGAYEFITTGIDESANDEVSVFPNPADQTVWIKCKSEINSIEIYNSMGELILSEAGNFPNLKTVDIGKLANGMYIIKVNEQSYVHSWNIIKN